MKRLLLVAVLSLSACSGEVVQLLGGESNLDDWRDRGVVINYWAEWCAPCREEIPEFNALLLCPGAAGPVVVGVNYDGLRGEELAAVTERMDIQFPTLLDDPRERFGYERPQMMPTTVLLDEALKVKEVLVGPQTAESLREALDN